MKPKHLIIPLTTAISIFGTEALSDKPKDMLPELAELAQLTRDNADKVLVCTGMALYGDLGSRGFYNEYIKDVQLSNGQECRITYLDKNARSNFDASKCFNPNDPSLQEIKDRYNYEQSRRAGSTSNDRVDRDDNISIECKKPDQSFKVDLHGIGVNAWGQDIPKPKTKKVRECSRPWDRNPRCKKRTQTYEYFPEEGKRKIKELLKQKATRIASKIRQRSK